MDKRYRQRQKLEQLQRALAAARHVIISIRDAITGMSDELYLPEDKLQVARYLHSLTDIAADVWQHHSGASDGLDYDELAWRVEWLQMRLDNWHPAVSWAESYDEAHRQMVIATLERHRSQVENGL